MIGLANMFAFFYNTVFLILYLFVILNFGCPGSLLLYIGFSHCREQGLFFIVMHGLVITVASPVEEHRI